jgi:hypothetical protein
MFDKNVLRMWDTSDIFNVSKVKLRSFSFIYFYGIEIYGAKVYWIFSYVDWDRKCLKIFLCGNLLEKVSLDDKGYVWLEKMVEAPVSWHALILSVLKFWCILN